MISKKTLFVIAGAVLLMTASVYLIIINIPSECEEGFVLAEDNTCVSESFYENDDDCKLMEDGRRFCYLGQTSVSGGDVIEEEFET